MKNIIQNVRMFGRDIIDRFAVFVGCWALRRLYGADCKMDVKEEFNDPNLKCVSCDAKRMIDEMKEIFQ